MLSASLVFAIPILTEISKVDRKFSLWGRDAEGVIDAITKKDTEKIYDYCREKIAEAKKEKTDSAQLVMKQEEDPISTLKKKFINGEISEDEYRKMMAVLEE